MDHGSDGQPSFHGNEVISAVEDEVHLSGEEEDCDDLCNDVNVSEGFYRPSINFDNASAVGYPKEDESSKDLPLLFMTPIPAGNPPGKLERPGNRFEDFPVKNLVKNDGFWKQGTHFVNEGFHRQGELAGGNNSANVAISGCSTGVAGPVGGNADSLVGRGGGTTFLFVRDLHWWTTDAELEAELCKYGPVKEVNFFDEKASGKSKGYARVEFYDSAATAACKEGMDRHVFNGRPCVVTFSPVHGGGLVAESQGPRNQPALAHTEPHHVLSHNGRGGGALVNGNYGRGRGNWGRGGIGFRGPIGNMSNRFGPAGGRGIMGNGGMVPPLPVHPGALLGQVFDPSGYGGVMAGRIGAGYGGFPSGPIIGTFPGMMPSFQPVVAPHVNLAFFGRGIPIGGMGMWHDPSMGGWGGEDQSSYGDDAASDQQYGDKNYGKDRGSDRDWPEALERRKPREKDVGPGQEWSESWHNSEKDVDRMRDHDWDGEKETARKRERNRDIHRELDKERDRDKYHDDRGKHVDSYRHRDREVVDDDGWDRGQSFNSRINSREVESLKKRRPSE